MKVKRENILRKKFKFKGLVISDDISMKAIKEDLQTKVTNCYEGGCDIVMYCKGDLNDIKLTAYITSASIGASTGEIVQAQISFQGTGALSTVTI